MLRFSHSVVTFVSQSGHFHWAHVQKPFVESIFSVLPISGYPNWCTVTIVTPTGVRTCHEGRDEMTSPAGRLTACLMHVGRTSDWHGCETRVE